MGKKQKKEPKYDVEFLVDGKWMDGVLEPIIHAKKGDIKTVSGALRDSLLKAKKAKDAVKKKPAFDPDAGNDDNEGDE